MSIVQRIGIWSAIGMVFAAGMARGDEFRIRPHLQNLSQTGATLIWETEDATRGAVRFGVKDRAMEGRVADSTATKIHRLRLEGLEADTEYTYRIEAGGDVQEATFITAPAGDDEITFVVVGDPRRWGDRWEETGMDEHVKQWNAGLFLTMGDLVPNGHEYDQWPEHFARFAGLTASKWFVTARGNHEGSLVRDAENDWFARYHELPGGEPYVHFDWGNTHFVLISYESTGRERDWTSSAQWLDQHLDSVDKRYTIVAHHFPLYCTGYDSTNLNRKEPGERAHEFWKVLDKHNVAMDLSGHTHIYERHYPLRNNRRDDRNGTYYVVNGGDINANYPDWWTAVSDDKATMAKPTYSVYRCNDDRLESRTFAWSKKEERIVQIDWFVIWKNEAIPKAVLNGLAQKRGPDLAAGIDELGALLYAPAAKVLLGYLGHEDEAVRLAAAKSISLIANIEIAEEVLEQVHHTDARISAYMARALEVALPKRLVRKVERLVGDDHTPNRSRFHLIGALQLHAPPKVAANAAMDLLEGDLARPGLRRRAAHALGQTATEEDVKDLTELIKSEEDRYVLMTLAWKLNRLTERRVSLRSNGDFAKSGPGDRKEFIKTWLGK